METTVDDSVTVAEAANRYGVHEKTIRRWIATGQLPAHRLGPRLIRVSPDDLDAVLRPMSVGR